MRGGLCVPCALLIGLTLQFLSRHRFVLGKQLVLLCLDTVSVEHAGSGVRLDRCTRPGQLVPHRGVRRPLFWV